MVDDKKIFRFIAEGAKRRGRLGKRRTDAVNYLIRARYISVGMPYERFLLM